MAFLQWEMKYSGGISLIDTQHQQWFALVNQFYESIQQKQTQQAIGDLLQGLIEYTQTHFLTEQTLLKKYQYPQYEQHLAKHEEFIARLHDFQTRFQNRKLLLPVEIADFLKQWLTGHVLHEDFRYAPFLQENMTRKTT